MEYFYSYNTKIIYFQSDTFADGEKPESPAPHVGEVLSREGSPSGQRAAEEGRTFTPPVADSPRESHGEEHFDVEALEETIISPEQDREALVEMYHVRMSYFNLLMMSATWLINIQPFLFLLFLFALLVTTAILLLVNTN